MDEVNLQLLRDGAIVQLILARDLATALGLVERRAAANAELLDDELCCGWRIVAANAAPGDPALAEGTIE
jgi:hypothetical protein